MGYRKWNWRNAEEFLLWSLRNVEKDSIDIRDEEYELDADRATWLNSLNEAYESNELEGSLQ